VVSKAGSFVVAAIGTVWTLYFALDIVWSGHLLLGSLGYGFACGVLAYQWLMWFKSGQK